MSYNDTSLATEEEEGETIKKYPYSLEYYDDSLADLDSFFALI